MWIILIPFVFGLLFGLVLQNSHWITSKTSKIFQQSLHGLVYLLIALMGIRVGANEVIRTRLPELGGISLALGALTIASGVFLVALLDKLRKKKGWFAQ